MKSLETEIVINAPTQQVWSILTDFEKYPEWNPFIKGFKGEVKEGAKFTVTLQPANSKPMTFHPKCLVLKKNREFRWLGHLFLKGLFDGEHIFELKEIKKGTTTKFIQRENFRGMLVPLLWKNLETNTRNGFVEMNNSLKKRAEEKAGQKD
jgi:hypothetical protein